MLARLVTQLLLLALAVGCTTNVTNVASEDDLSKNAWQGFTDLTTTQKGFKKIISANFEEEADGADTYTVQFNVVPPKLPAAAGIFAAQALITWMVEGQPVQRQCDVGNGVSVTGRGEAVTVEVQDTTPAFGGGIAANAPYTVSATMTRGSRATTAAPPTFTPTSDAGGSAGTSGFQGTVVLAAGNAINFPVQPGFSSVEVVLGPSAAGAGQTPAGQVRVNQVGGANVVKSYDPAVNTGFVALASNATSVLIFNFSAGNVAVTCTFGVDG